MTVKCSVGLPNTMREAFVALQEQKDINPPQTLKQTEFQRQYSYRERFLSYIQLFILNCFGSEHHLQFTCESALVKPLRVKILLIFLRDFLHYRVNCCLNNQYSLKYIPYSEGRVIKTKTRQLLLEFANIHCYGCNYNPE